MKKKINYFCIDNERIIKLKQDKTKDRINIFVKDKQKVYYPDLIKYLKENNDNTILNDKLKLLLYKVEHVKNMSEMLLSESKNNSLSFFNKYCSKMDFKYTNENILYNKQSYTEEELFISRFVEQCGIKRFSSSTLYQCPEFGCLKFGNRDSACNLFNSLNTYHSIVSVLYRLLKELLYSCTYKNKKKLSFFEMKIVKFIFGFKSFFYLSILRNTYITRNDCSSPRNMKKDVDMAIASASKMVDIYFLRNVQTDNIKYKSFFNSFNNLSFDDRIGNTDYLEKFDEYLEMMCHEKVILPEMMKLHSFQYILPMYMSNDLVNMVRSYGIFMLNYRTPLINDGLNDKKTDPIEFEIINSRRAKDIAGDLYSYYSNSWESSSLFLDNIESIFVGKLKNRNICYFDDGMLTIEYIELVINACLDIGHNYDFFGSGLAPELRHLLVFSDIKTERDEEMDNRMLSCAVTNELDKLSSVTKADIFNYIKLSGLSLDKERIEFIRKRYSVKKNNK